MGLRRAVLIALIASMPLPAFAGSLFEGVWRGSWKDPTLHQGGDVVFDIDAAGAIHGAVTNDKIGARGPMNGSITADGNTHVTYSYDDNRTTYIGDGLMSISGTMFGGFLDFKQTNGQKFGTGIFLFTGGPALPAVAPVPAAPPGPVAEAAPPPAPPPPVVDAPPPPAPPPPLAAAPPPAPPPPVVDAPPPPAPAPAASPELDALRSLFGAGLALQAAVEVCDVGTLDERASLKAKLSTFKGRIDLADDVVDKIFQNTKKDIGKQCGNYKAAFALMLPLLLSDVPPDQWTARLKTTRPVPALPPAPAPEQSDAGLAHWTIDHNKKGFCEMFRTEQKSDADSGTKVFLLFLKNNEVNVVFEYSNWTFAAGANAVMPVRVDGTIVLPRARFQAHQADVISGNFAPSFLRHLSTGKVVTLGDPAHKVDFSLDGFDAALADLRACKE